ncbi:MAG: RHS repeat-associated core domain-containing protein, partial [Clostridia bacterium]|nr:RHS repeat-associated core domain-containing protein [Clostridia bacterium]
NIVYIDQKTSSTNGTFAFNFTLPQNSGVSNYGYIIGTDADTETYIGVINMQQSGNEDDDDDDDNDHGGDTDITGTTVTVKYYLGADGVFAQTDKDGTSYLFKNGHGDTVTIVRNGNVVDDAEYDAYGNVKNPQNITAYTYANYYYDSHSGMYYLRNRFYDSSIARFISEDPIQDGINWYAYCGGNPIAFVDPWGLYYLEKGEDGRIYAIIESGDTLSGIAEGEVADPSAWKK